MVDGQSGYSWKRPLEKRGSPWLIVLSSFLENSLLLDVIGQARDSNPGDIIDPPARFYKFCLHSLV